MNGSDLAGKVFTVVIALEILGILAYFFRLPLASLWWRIRERARSRRLAEERALWDAVCTFVGRPRPYLGNSRDAARSTVDQWMRVRIPVERKVALILAGVEADNARHYRRYTLEDLATIAALGSSHFAMG